MTHLLIIDELRRQYEMGEITQAEYEAARETKWEDVGCSVTKCTRTAFVLQRGRPLCAVCALVERNKRR